MTKRLDDNDKPASRRLKLASELVLPRTLGELAGESNIGAGLEKKLGEDALWLLADSMYAYMDDGEPIYFDDTHGIPVPVQFSGVRHLVDEPGGGLDRYRTLPFEQLAVFATEPRLIRDIEQFYDHAVYDYFEVAVRLGQSATLLELYEINPRVDVEIEKWRRYNQHPFLAYSKRR